MAVYGVLADIHGNREALAAALAALERRGVRRLLCLGDVVGYNADPDECVALLRARNAQVIAGNHDLIGTGRLGFQRCSNKAHFALRRTRRALSTDSKEWLSKLPPSLLVEDSVALVHGGVRDVQQYLRTPALILENAALLEQDFPSARLCFFGHSHEQQAYELNGEKIAQVGASGTLRLIPSLRYFINPGSVDASRKRGPKLAECAILDTGAWSVEFLRLPYDAASTEAKAAVYGYRINPLAERWYSLRRRFAGLAGRLSAEVVRRFRHAGPGRRLRSL